MPRLQVRPRRVILVLVAAALAALAACGSKRDPGREAARDAGSGAAATAPAAPGAAAPGTGTNEPAAPVPPPPPPKPKFQIQLRSTPTGAEASVDGRPIGRTPTTAMVEDDGAEHEFTFVLPGYSLERYRTRPVQSGVIHARMRSVAVDAGPRTR